MQYISQIVNIIILKKHFTGNSETFLIKDSKLNWNTGSHNRNPESKRSHNFESQKTIM